MTYHIKLQNTVTSDILEVDIEQSSAFGAQTVAESLYEGFKALAITYTGEDVIANSDYRLTEGAYGDDLDF